MRFIMMPDARDDLGRLPKNIRRRIAKKLRMLAGMDDPLKLAKHLEGFDVYRFRVSDYRIIGEVIKGAFYILLIRRRDNAYRGL